ncbi:MAG: hypothetical protein PF440_01265 [Thiomicrorhabdus sp.]|jgi:hypothetical protein|nr:hypothetical protein [Thiomicrorhabdus sp.]
MLKKEVIEFFAGVGGTAKDAAEKIGISSAAISKWPNELTDDMQGKVLVACRKLKKRVPKHW